MMCRGNNGVNGKEFPTENPTSNVFAVIDDIKVPKVVFPEEIDHAWCNRSRNDGHR
jgi:hypothetical protein